MSEILAYTLAAALVASVVVLTVGSWRTPSYPPAPKPEQHVPPPPTWTTVTETTTFPVSQYQPPTHVDVRRRAGWTLRRLAEEMGTSMATVHRAENGHYSAEYLRRCMDTPMVEWAKGLEPTLTDRRGGKMLPRRSPLAEEHRRCREALGLSVAQLSEKTGYSESYIKRIEDGQMQRHEPGTDYIARATFLSPAFSAWAQDARDSRDAREAAAKGGA